jgi:hypothetical protein
MIWCGIREKLLSFSIIQLYSRKKLLPIAVILYAFQVKIHIKEWEGKKEIPYVYIERKIFASFSHNFWILKLIYFYGNRNFVQIVAIIISGNGYNFRIFNFAN